VNVSTKLSLHSVKKEKTKPSTQCREHPDMSGSAAALMMEIGQGSYTLLKKKKKKKLSAKLPLDCILYFNKMLQAQAL
jgi:hypothetical protein